LRLYGNVDIREVQLAFRQPGRVMQMAFDEGDAVSAGARLAALDAQPYRDALAAAQAQVQVAQAELAKLRRGLRPQEITQAREALRQAQALATEPSAISSARAACWHRAPAASARSMPPARRKRSGSRGRRSGQGRPVASIRRFSQGRHRRGRSSPCGRTGCRSASHDALADTELTAPSSGTVIARVREPGSMVASQSTVYSLSLDKPVYVRAYVGESDSGAHRARHCGARQERFIGEKVYRGQIGFISPRAEFTPKTVETTDLRTDLVYRLRIVIDEADSDSRLAPGHAGDDRGRCESRHPARAGER
jgi:HlyD family secretion protein